MHLKLLCLAALSVMGAAGAGEPVGKSESRDLRNLDLGDVEHFNSCRALARRVLSDRERCEVEQLALRCTPADDCLVTCISSPDGHLVGGGCAHVCFSNLHKVEEPPESMYKCDGLNRRID